MKNNPTIARMAGLALIVLISACSGNKKETAKTNDGSTYATKADSSKTEIVAFENVDPSVKAQLNGFLADYFALNQALIEDNQDGAKSAAKKLAGTVGQFDMSKLQGDQMGFYHVQLYKIDESLKGMAESTDIEETRLELSTLSEAMYALVKAYKPNESELYYQYCPMAFNNKGGHWISKEKEISNPYFGSKMMRCGETVKELN